MSVDHRIRAGGSRLGVTLAVAWALLPASAAALTVTGSVGGVDGAPLPLAHVTAGDGEAAEVGRDGRFQVELPDGGGDLMVTGVGHEAYRFDLLAPARAQGVEIAVRLRPYRYKETFDAVEVVGSWSDYDAAVPMEAQPDGTFRLTVPSDAVEVGYQVVGVDQSEGFHSLNGTLASRLEYDGGGDYISYVPVSDGQATIVFDPARLERVPAHVSATITFADPAGAVARMTGVLWRVRAERAAQDAAAARYRDEHGGSLDGLWESVDLAPQRRAFQHEMRRSFDPDVKAAWAVGWMALHSRAALAQDASPRFARKALAAAPADAPAWRIDGGWEALGWLLPHDPAATALVESLGETHPSPELRGEVRYARMEALARAGDDAALDAEYERFLAELGDIPLATLVKMRYDPENPLRVGRTLPVLDVPVLGDADRHMTSEDLAGKVWMVEFWATWCGPCVAEMPWIHAAWETWHPRGLEILSISMDAEAAEPQAFRAGQWAMPWANAFGSDSPSVKDGYRIRALPTSVLIDATGRIVAANEDLRGEALDLTLEEVLGGGEADAR